MTSDSQAVSWQSNASTEVTLRTLAVGVWLLPRNIAIAVMKLYRLAISPLYGDVCRYYPSCSAYSLQSFQRFGFIRGVWSTLLRLVRCNPFSQGGIDDVPERRGNRFTITHNGFVVPASRKGQ